MKKVWSRQNKIMSYLYDTSIHLTRHILLLKFMWIFFRSIYDCSFTIFITLFLLYTWYIIQKFWTSEQWHPPITDLPYHHLFYPLSSPLIHLFGIPLHFWFGIHRILIFSFSVQICSRNCDIIIWTFQYRWRQKKCERRKFAVLR